MININDKVTYNEFFQQARDVYSFLADEKSRDIFESKLNYIVTGRSKYYKKIINCATDIIQEAVGKLFSIITENETIILYGAGIEGLDIFRRFDELYQTKNLIFCDKNAKEIKEHNGYPVITPEELFEKYRDNQIVITPLRYRMEIKSYLIERNIPEEQIHFIHHGDAEQYFDEVIKFENNEIFLDVGVLNGNTSVQFARRCPNYKHIYMFEPDKKSIIRTIGNMKQNNIENFTLFEKGAWNNKETLYFSNDENFGANRVLEEGEITIEADSIDNMMGGTAVTFIKMDIEGAELNALIGAENTIKKYKPKLAISIYHKDEDIINIPLYIKSLVPEYTFYIRHYSDSIIETILYAVL